MRYRIPGRVTLRSVTSGERRYDEACADHAREMLRRWVAKFPSQDAAAAALGVNQGTVSRALMPENQPSLKVLIPLSKLTGWSLDEIFGLVEELPPSAPAPVRLTDSQMHRVAEHVAERVAERVARRLTPPGGIERPVLPPPKPGKK